MEKWKVSILVLMDLCIKTLNCRYLCPLLIGFNPCFNGSMYKNTATTPAIAVPTFCFNPCFNGSMYKNYFLQNKVKVNYCVSILVLMDLCIKTYLLNDRHKSIHCVSILVLMDLCIKTALHARVNSECILFQSLF